MNLPFFRFTFFLLMSLTLPLTATAQVVSIPEPVPPPKEVRVFFELDPFYEQWIDVGGLPVLASAKVNPYALKEAAWLIGKMIGNRPDILQTMAGNKARFSVIAHTEVITEIPEYRSDPRPDFLVYRERGWGGSEGATITSSEEGILHYSGNIYGKGYNVQIHEFAHGIHLLGLNTFDPTFEERLKTTYKTAMQRGLWSGTYASADRKEYWAEGTYSWFYPRGGGSFDRFGNTRQELKEYDPGLAILLSEVYGDTEWHYTPVTDRIHQPHLQGFDPQDSPTFIGFPQLEVLYQQLRVPNSDGNGAWVNLAPYDPEQLPSLIKSNVPETNTTAIAFVNLSKDDVLLYWVGSDGTEGHWTRASPDFPIRVTPSRVNAIWLVKDTNGKNLAVFQAEEKTGRALITPTLNLITPGLSKVSGDNQSGVSGAVLSNPFVIEVRDGTLSALEGISVTFTVTAGNGTLSTTRTTTDRNGRAESTLTLGGNLGTNTVSVSAAGIVGAVTFNAVAEAMVDIPDPNLRAVVLTALGKAKNDPITPSEMSTLTRLEKRRANISNLTGLESATNLTTLDLDENNITDISAVKGLTNLTWLNLGGNNISDISAVEGLTNLIGLSLYGNNISDISVLAGLTNLTRLWVNGNSISDISPLAGLAKLTRLGLSNNSISGISALASLTNLTLLKLDNNSISDLSPLVANTGLGSRTEINVKGNPLSYLSIHTHIPALQSRGVTVEFDNQAHPALLKIAGDNQNGASFAPLSQPFVVEAQDANGSALAGVSVTFAVVTGGGTLSTTITRTDENGRAQSTLTLGPNLGTNTVQVSAAGIDVPATFHAISDTEAPLITADVNNDGSVNILDLILIASKLGNTGTNLVVDVNRDGTVSILDLILAAGMFDGAAAAPSVQPQVPETLTAVEVQGWLIDARSLEVRDSIMKRGFVVLEQLLVSLTPRETELLANYPNPFNPETWIPYRLAEDAFVTLTIYDLSGQVVRTVQVGHRIAAAYENRSKAIYWDGRNEVGEQVASGVYFYNLSTRNYSATRKMLVVK